jgi:hypothetical protein
MICLAGANRELMAFIHDNGNNPDWPWRPNTMWTIFNFDGGQLQIAPIEALITFRQNLLIRAEGTWTGDFVPASKAPTVAELVEATETTRPRMLTMAMPELRQGYLTEMPEEPVRMLETVLRTDRLPNLITERKDEACPVSIDAPAKTSVTPLPPIGFHVYRANLAVSSTYVRLNTAGPVTTTTFIDTEYPSIDRGQFRYAVRALYVGGIESELSLSNVLDKDIFLSASSTVRLTHNATGHPLSLISGASLRLVNNTTRQEYTGTFGATGIMSIGGVYRGIYTLTINSVVFEN